MAKPVMTLRVHDRVEDRSLFSGAGEIVYLRGNEVFVRFDDGSEEAVDEELFVPHADRVWLI
jgi:hypothetical protein